MNSRYFDTAVIVGEFKDTEDLAVKLQSRTWE